MTLTLTLEHELTTGKVVTEQFEGVESFNNPPMTSVLHLNYPEGTGNKKLRYGHVIKAESENE